jgi:GH24 family phage-related lysozyme (muramidase)
MKLSSLHNKQQLNEQLEEGKGTLALAGLGAGALAALGIGMGNFDKDLESKRASIQQKLASQTSHPPAPKGVLKSPYHLTQPEPPIPKQEPIQLVPDHLRMHDLSVQSYTEFTAFWEGFRALAYDDMVKRGNRTIAIKTIGYGYNMDKPGANEGLIKVGIERKDIPKIRDAKMPITKEQAIFLFRTDIEDAITRARKDIPNFLDQPDMVKLIVVDMTYQLYTINKLPKFRSFIIKRNYKKAAEEAINSAWYSQSGRRSKHHVEKLLEVIK